VIFNGKGGNPPINFDAEFPEIMLTLGSDEVVPVDTQFYQGEVPIQELIVKSPLSDPQCPSIPELKYLSKPVFARFDDNFWIHDPRFVSSSLMRVFGLMQYLIFYLKFDTARIF
jgi:hypothetical protein